MNTKSSEESDTKTDRQKENGTSQEIGEGDMEAKDVESTTLETHPHPIKSRAVVKYSATQSPAHFAELQCNTDLNMPPSNWLSSSAEPYGLHYLPSHSTGFSSFKMAHMFPDCVGEVDVVSDAENIKKLLKIPYSRGPVSMMVHRIENTLLIDEFDIHKHLLITAKKEWEWLKKFFFNHVLASLDDKEKGLYQKNRTRGALQQRSLVSKFLYRSLAADSIQDPQHKGVDTNEANYDKIKGPQVAPDPVAVHSSDCPPLPEPREDEAVPDAISNHNFTRNVVWTFEDIQMLIGTDMPIFGGSTHPCISLRLREMTRPINVLTGIDYWLDNLMCNVPEVVMCYHLAGIVQRYELIKTEDLPHLANSKFSPKLIRDVAQNILSFLKSNATKAGHTYWLFRGRDDDIVKLYDLTSLCTDVMDDKGQNPFTVPVGMLLYRVARNMKQPKQNKRQQATIQTLLKNCLTLLAKEKYPKIVASAHYMLSDLYIPAGIDPASPNLHSPSSDKEEKEEIVINSQSEDESHKDEELEGQDGILQSPVSKTQDDFAEREVAVQSLCVSKSIARSDRHRRKRSSKHNSAPFEVSSLKERSQMALNHVSMGLSCLHYLKANEECDSAKESLSGKPKKPFYEEEPKMARSYQAIPMPYAHLGDENKEKKPLSEEDGKIALDDGMRDGNMDQKSNAGLDEPWGAILRGLLYEKAALVLATLTDVEYKRGNLGTTLGLSVSTLHCCEILEKLRGENLEGVGGLVRGRQKRKGDTAEGRWYDLDELRACVLSRAGDAAFMVVKEWKNLETIRREFMDSFNSFENEIHAHIEEDLQLNGLGGQIDSLPLTLREDWKNNTTSEEELISFFSKALDGSIEEMLLVSCCCYQYAFSLTRSSSHAKGSGKSGNQSAADVQRDMLLQRLGNIHNELGALYNGKVEESLLKEDNEPEKSPTNTAPLSMLTVKELARMSCEHFEAGIKAFGFISDRQNMALLNSNLGRLMQLQAHRAGSIAKSKSLLHKDKKLISSKQERIFYNKAIDSYQRALDILQSKEEYQGIWNAVASGLSSALFNYAVCLNNKMGKYTGKISDDLEEVVEAFKRALKACDVESDDARAPFFQYRAALIHNHLAGIYYDKYRSLTPVTDGQDDSSKYNKRKGRGVDIAKVRGNLSLRALQASHQHYEKAFQLLLDLERPSECLKIVIERVDLEEYLSVGADRKLQLKRLIDAIKHIICCKRVMEILLEKTEEDRSNAISNKSLPDPVKQEDSSRSLQQKGENDGIEDRLNSTLSEGESASDEQKKKNEIDDSDEEQNENFELLQSLKGKLQTGLLKLAQLSSSHFKDLVGPFKRLYRLAIEMDMKNVNEADKMTRKVFILASQLKQLLERLEEEIKNMDIPSLE